MSHGQYIRIDELVLLTTFVLLVPAAIAVAAQVAVLLKQRLWKRAPTAATLGVIGSVAGGTILTVLLMALLPQSVVPFVGIREVTLLGRSVIILPLAFLAFGLSAAASTVWTARRARSAA